MRLKYTAELLAPIVASSTSFSDVMSKLGLKPTGGHHRLITARIRLAGLDTSHFNSRRSRARIEALTRDEVAALASNTFSIAQMLNKLELPRQAARSMK